MAEWPKVSKKQKAPSAHCWVKNWAPCVTWDMSLNSEAKEKQCTAYFSQGACFSYRNICSRVVGKWDCGEWENSLWIQQRNEVSLMPSTGMVAPGPGTCCSAGDHKIRVCSHVKLDAASGMQAWKGCQAKVMLCRSQGCSGTCSSRSCQRISTPGVLVLRAHRCPGKTGREAEPKECCKARSAGDNGTLRSGEEGHSSSLKEEELPPFPAGAQCRHQTENTQGWAAACK